MKKLVSFLLTLTLVLSCLSMVCFAANTASGTCGDNLTWTLDNSGKLTVSGTGSMTDYTYPSSAPWYSYRSQIKKVVIGQGVTSIGNDAFCCCDSLTSITIPNSVTSIGDDAFSGCDSLTSITLPNSVTSIGDAAFCGCDSLTSITLPNSVTSIGDWAFSGCESLTSITIPNSVIGIGEGVFADSGIVSLTVAGENPMYYSEGNCIIRKSDKELIAGCKTSAIPNGVTGIGGDAFCGCIALTSITIPNSVTSIGDRAFNRCESLTSITIPNSVTSIGDFAFYECTSLTSVMLSNSVTSIGVEAFSWCTSLTSITIPNSVTSIGNYAFNGCTSLTSITLPNSVTSIGYSAFHGCTSLTSITIPNSVTSIGDYAFGYCQELRNVYYTGSRAQWNNIAIRSGNDKLLDASIHYDWVPPVYPDTNPNDWYYPAVKYVAEKGIFTGYTSGAKKGLFGVSDPIQRQDFLVALARYGKVDAAAYTGNGGFRDVDAGGYYAFAVVWGAQKNITSGYTSGANAGKFGVGDNITREQLVTFIYRYAKSIGADVSVTTTAAYWRSRYPDWNKVSSFSQEAIIWALEKGVISGKTVGRDVCIAPQGNAQRCEVAQIFYNIEQKNVFG